MKHIDIGRRGFLRLGGAGALWLAAGCASAPAPLPLAVSRDKPTLIYFFTNP